MTPSLMVFSPSEFCTNWEPRTNIVLVVFCKGTPPPMLYHPMWDPANADTPDMIRFGQRSYALGNFLSRMMPRAVPGNAFIELISEKFSPWPVMGTSLNNEVTWNDQLSDRIQFLHCKHQVDHLSLIDELKSLGYYFDDLMISHIESPWIYGVEGVRTVDRFLTKDEKYSYYDSWEAQGFQFDPSTGLPWTWDDFEKWFPYGNWWSEILHWRRRKLSQRLLERSRYGARSPLYQAGPECYFGAFALINRSAIVGDRFSFTVSIMQNGLVLAQDVREGIIADASEGMLVGTSSSAAQRIFGSYSRRDIEVVRMVSSVLKTTGLGELRWDLDFLSAGDVWDEKVSVEIATADAFQLFWSENARRSINVEKEWKLALSLNRRNFVRPVYWETPIPAVPNDLSHIHFALLDVPHKPRSRMESLFSRFRGKDKDLTRSLRDHSSMHRAVAEVND
jgi:hypothetical protein